MFTRLFFVPRIGYGYFYFSFFYRSLDHLDRYYSRKQHCIFSILRKAHRSLAVPRYRDHGPYCQRFRNSGGKNIKSCEHRPAITDTPVDDAMSTLFVPTVEKRCAIVIARLAGTIGRMIVFPRRIRQVWRKFTGVPAATVLD